MTLNITHLVNGDDMVRYSASIAEIGEMAGQITWNNAQSEAADAPLLKTHEDCDYARKFFSEFGAWHETELAAMSDTEINALTLQYIAGDIREMERYDTILELRAE